MTPRYSADSAGGRRAAADERDRIADERERLADAREMAWAERERHLDAIFAAAALRDDRAAIRDFRADQRDTAANLQAFVDGVDDDSAFRARELAKADRVSAKADRVAAEVDRFVLCDLGPASAEREGAREHRFDAQVEGIAAASSGTDERSRAHAV